MQRKTNKYLDLYVNKVLALRHKGRRLPIPEIGKKYHCFDDGKITFSRHFIIKVDEILGYFQFKKKYPELFQRYIKCIKRSYWLYSKSSDKFIITYDGENNEIGVYVRMRKGGWFGIGPWWNSAELDVTGCLWDNLVAHIDDFDYTEEEKEKLVKENTI